MDDFPRIQTGPMGGDVEAENARARARDESCLCDADSPINIMTMVVMATPAHTHSLFVHFLVGIDVCVCIWRTDRSADRRTIWWAHVVVVVCSSVVCLASPRTWRIGWPRRTVVYLNNSGECEQRVAHKLSDARPSCVTMSFISEEYQNRSERSGRNGNRIFGHAIAQLDRKSARHDVEHEQHTHRWTTATSSRIEHKYPHFFGEHLPTDTHSTPRIDYAHSPTKSQTP